MNARAVYDATLVYLRNALLGLDMLGNTLMGGLPGDTISYSAAVAQKDGETWGCVLCKLLNLFQKNHCEITLAYNLHQRVVWGQEIAEGETPL